MEIKMVEFSLSLLEGGLFVKKISDFELSFKECICIFGDAFAISNNG